MFLKKKDTPQQVPAFTSRADAFAYMLAWQLNEREVDPMTAAKEANEFADIFARNMGLPISLEPPAQGVEKVIKNVDKVVCYCEEHPKVVEYITGALTFAAGIFTARKTDNDTQTHTTQEPIDFENID